MVQIYLFNQIVGNISIKNGMFTAVCTIKLEKLHLNYKMNHFAIKEKIYIEALKVAYQKVGELIVA